MDNWKDRLGIVFSTNSDHQYEYDEPEEQETLPKDRQKLRVKLDKRQRNGKEVTLVEGFVGADADFAALGKFLKQKCGVGGTAKDGIILVQGDHRERVRDLLLREGYEKTRII